MSGKWPMIRVLGLGLIASLCAAVLMAAMRASGSESEIAEPTEIDVVVAADDLPAMTKIEESVIELTTVALGERPEGSFTDPVQVLGRILKTPLVRGQPLTEGSLLSDEAGARLAGSLEAGTRAVSVELKATSAMRGLLYPGCRVDVIVAYKLMGPRDASGPTSETLLQNERTLMVTLMVDPQQARELQAARDRGELALTLRNPLDGSLTADPEPGDGLGPESPGVPPPLADEGPWTLVVIRGDEREVRRFDKRGEEVEPPVEGEERYADAPTEPPLEIDE